MAAPAIAIAAARLLGKGEKVAVVRIHNRRKKYSYFMDEEFSEGDEVIVPVKEGGPLHATILMISSAGRWTGQATRTIISKA